MHAQAAQVSGLHQAGARLALVVDDAVHAQAAQALRLGLAACGGHHAAARQQCQLRAKVACAARRGRDEGCLALTQRAARDLHASALSPGRHGSHKSLFHPAFAR